MNEDAGPIFRQVADQIENAIVDGSLPEETQAPSSNELAAFHRINPATAAKGLNQLVADGVLYVADSENARIRAVDLATGIITTVVGTGAKRFAGDGGQAILAGLRNPRGVSFDAQGRLLVADTLNNRIRAVGP